MSSPPGRTSPAALLILGVVILLPGCATGMVKISGGKFLMGSADPASPTNEMPLHPADLDSFRIGRFEVTNLEYKEFLDETGYRPDEQTDFLKHWEGGTYPPRQADHPVVYVNYHDAEAYLEWVGRRLPTEAEWEKAATWDSETKTKRPFPWGQKYSPWKARIEAQWTAPVGSKPEGNTPEGVSDLYGNVWEWTASWFQPYPQNEDGNPDYGERLKVTRGASFHTREITFTCTTRNPKDPSTRSPLIGFRAAK